MAQATHYYCSDCRRDISTIVIEGLSHPIMVRMQVAHLEVPERFDPRAIGVSLTDFVRDVASSAVGIKEFCLECFAGRTGQKLQPTVDENKGLIIAADLPLDALKAAA